MPRTAIKTSAASSPTKHAPGGRVTVGRTSMQVTEPKPGPVKKVTVVRSNRIEDINGLIEEIGIINSIASTKKDKVEKAKRIMIDAHAQKMESAHFVATISGGGPTRCANVERFLSLCREKNIPEEKVRACMSVSLEKITDILSGDEINSVCDEGPYRDQALRVDPRADVPPLELVDAVKAYAKSVSSGNVQVPAKFKVGGRAK